MNRSRCTPLHQHTKRSPSGVFLRRRTRPETNKTTYLPSSSLNQRRSDNISRSLPRVLPLTDTSSALNYHGTPLHDSLDQGHRTRDLPSERLSYTWRMYPCTLGEHNQQGILCIRRSYLLQAIHVRTKDGCRGQITKHKAHHTACPYHRDRSIISRADHTGDTRRRDTCHRVISSPLDSTSSQPS